MAVLDGDHLKYGSVWPGIKRGGKPSNELFPYGEKGYPVDFSMNNKGFGILWIAIVAGILAIGLLQSNMERDKKTEPTEDIHYG